jgi:predicted nucleic acid-binding protein
VILADTSIWTDHFRRADDGLAGYLDAREILAHPYVIGELTLGHLRERRVILRALHNLPKVEVATDREVLEFIDRQSLFGLGIGYVDVHLLASIRLTSGSRLWSRDRRLNETAQRLGLPLHVSIGP